MKGRSSVWRRTQRLTGIYGDVATQLAVRQAAMTFGLDEDEVIAEAQGLARLFADRRLRTDADRIAYLAEQDGCSVAELTAELAEIHLAMRRP